MIVDSRQCIQEFIHIHAFSCVIFELVILEMSTLLHPPAKLHYVLIAFAWPLAGQPRVHKLTIY